MVNKSRNELKSIPFLGILCFPQSVRDLSCNLHPSLMFSLCVAYWWFTWLKPCTAWVRFPLQRSTVVLLNTPVRLFLSFETQAFLLFKRRLLKYLNRQHGHYYARTKHVTGVVSSRAGTTSPSSRESCLLAWMETAHTRARPAVFPLNPIIWNSVSSTIMYCTLFYLFVCYFFLHPILLTSETCWINPWFVPHDTFKMNLSLTSCNIKVCRRLCFYLPGVWDIHLGDVCLHPLQWRWMEFVVLWNLKGVFLW